MSMGKPRGNVAKRNVVLKIETYNRLEKLLVELVKERGTLRVSFDEAVNMLLDEHEKRESE